MGLYCSIFSKIIAVWITNVFQKFFMGILSRCLGQQCLLFNYHGIAKYSQENFCSTLKNYENRESLA